MAALSHEWRVGIWDLEEGKLTHILEVPTGRSAENAALAFGPEGQFAFAAGSWATLWRLDKDRAVLQQKWSLQSGLQDQIVFTGRDSILLCRAEHENGDLLVVARELQGDGNAPPLWRNGLLTGRIYRIVLTPDGKHVLAEGRAGPRESPTLLVCYEAATGRICWGPLNGLPRETGNLAIDPEGQLVGVESGPDAYSLLHVTTGQPIVLQGRTNGRGTPVCVGPGPRYPLLLSVPTNEREGRHILLDPEAGDNLVLVRAGKANDNDTACFSRDGKYLALGNMDGSVTICDLTEIRRRLDQGGLNQSSD